MTPKRADLTTLDLDAEQLMIRRWKGHCISAKRSSLVFHKAIRKYGEGVFEHQVLEICDSLETALKREVFWIAVHKSTIDENGYNMTLGGEGNVMTASSKEKHRIATSVGTRRAFQNVELRRRHKEATKRALNDPLIRAKMKASQRKAQARPEVKTKISDSSKRAWANPNSGLCKRKKPIQQLTLDDVLLTTFESAHDAARSCNLSQGNISACARGKTKHAGGFHWRYVDVFVSKNAYDNV